MWLSTIGITQGIAAVLIPTLAGVMIDNWGWRSVYYLMMAIQAVGLILTLTVTPKDTAQRNYVEKKFDVWGTILFTLWVSCCVLACNFGNSWGWGSAKITRCLLLP